MILQFISIIIIIVLGIYLIVTSENTELMIYSKKLKRVGIGVDYEVYSNSMHDIHTFEISLIVLFISLTFTRYKTS